MRPIRRDPTSFGNTRYGNYVRNVNGCLEYAEDEALEQTVGVVACGVKNLWTQTNTPETPYTDWIGSLDPSSESSDDCMDGSSEDDEDGPDYVHSVGLLPLHHQGNKDQQEEEQQQSTTPRNEIRINQDNPDGIIGVIEYCVRKYGSTDKDLERILARKGRPMKRTAIKKMKSTHLPYLGKFSRKIKSAVEQREWHVVLRDNEGRVDKQETEEKHDLYIVSIQEQIEKAKRQFKETGEYDINIHRQVRPAFFQKIYKKKNTLKSAALKASQHYSALEQREEPEHDELQHEELQFFTKMTKMVVTKLEEQMWRDPYLTQQLRHSSCGSEY
mmetsp:Transcript_21558/g.47309  ORF Transcript_21558/g.47309 Transcript_21558/m.47309 type:complete len:329 (-) Transcript_21558:15-1001(-)